MKVFDEKDNEVEAYKLPYRRKVNCRAYNSNGYCKYLGTSFIEGGCWEGAICCNPKAQGNKNGWLITCPNE